MSSHRLPSVKTLSARLGCDSTIAGAVRHVLNMNNRTDLEINNSLKAVSVLLHGYGVEYLPSKQDTYGGVAALSTSTWATRTGRPFSTTACTDASSAHRGATSSNPKGTGFKTWR